MSYVKNHIDAMSPYVPGEQPAGPRRIVKLNTNENPYPPSPQVRDVLRSVLCEELRVYPRPDARKFIEAVAETLRLPREMLLAANGSDNLLLMIARAAAGPGRRVAWLQPTFPFYETQARIEASEILEVPFEDDFAFPLQGLIDAQPAVAFIASPNSPTGTAATTDQLETLAKAMQGRGLLVIDEAYADFSDAHALELPLRYDNVIVLRTLSKGYSLAGLRLGFAVAQPALLGQLWKTKEIYNVGVLAERIGAVAIRDQAHLRENVAKIRASREKLTVNLRARGWTVWPSQANFLLARPAGGDARGAFETLKAGGVLVRYFDKPPMDDKLRITVGTDEQCAALLRALDARS